MQFFNLRGIHCFRNWQLEVGARLHDPDDFPETFDQALFVRRDNKDGLPEGQNNNHNEDDRFKALSWNKLLD